VTRLPDWMGWVLLAVILFIILASVITHAG
jgi:hypothetical protein